MPLPYQNTTSGQNSINELQKILSGFGCNKFGHMTDYDNGKLILQFEYRGRQVSAEASMKGYAAAWLKEHPYFNHRKSTRQDYEKKALEVAGTAVYSILRDWIKGQVMAIETGILSFEGAFLGQIMLPNGQTVLQRIQTDNLLPAPSEAA